MVGLLSDSLDSHEDTELKVSSSAVDNTVPNISELDFSSPLFDSLPDFETLKDYWMESPGEEVLGSGKESVFEIEEVMDMVGSESGVGMQPEVKNESLSAPTEGGGNERDSHVVNGEKEVFKENEMSRQGRAVVEIENGDIQKLEQEELEEGKSLNIGNVGFWSAEVGESEALEELKNAQKMKTEVRGCLSLTIEEDMKKVSLDGPGGVSVAGCDVNVKAERKTDENKKGSSDEAESESESESSLSEASSSMSSSSSDDDDVVKRNAELAGLIEEGEIVDEDVEQMVAWSDDDDDEVLKGPIRSKNEITDLPPVPKIDVTLSPNHQTLPVGVILSIVGKQVIVEGVEKHNPLNEGSILWLTKSRMPLGLVDDIFGPVKNPYYSIRYNNEDEVPSGISVGTPISFVAEFVNHVLNDPSLYKKGYDASNENDEELSEDTEFSDDEKEAEYRRMLKLSKRGSNEEAVGKKKKDKRNKRNQERNKNNQRPSPQLNSNEANLLANHNSHNPLAAETPGNQSNKFSGGGQAFPLSSGMAAPFQDVRQPATFNLGSNGMWPNGMPIQQQQQPMFFPSPFPTNAMPWMQQNNLIRNPYMSMSMSMLHGMPFSQQFGPNQMLPPNFVSPMGQQTFMGNNSDSSFPSFFCQNNFSQGNGLAMATSMPGTSLTDPSFSERNDALQQPATFTGDTNNGHQVRPDMSFSHGRNSNSQWRGRSGSRGGRFCRGRGYGGRGRGRQ